MNRTETQEESIVAKRLNELLRSTHTTKANLARVAGVSPQSVNGWFKRGSISKEAASRLSHEFGVSLAWLLGESESKDHATLSPEEERLLYAFNQLPPTERNNMLLAFEMRLQELKDFYTKYVNQLK
ncbi:helix-turn-helix transcriptional regulator [Salmonella enterica]|nr:helix-turn-helix transcriptional regulator [Salmonella enterica]